MLSSFVLCFRYQQSLRPVSPSKKQPPSSDLPHSISVDTPNELAKQPSPKDVGRVPHSKSMGEPGQLKVVHHLTQPVDKHRVGRKKAGELYKLPFHAFVMQSCIKLILVFIVYTYFALYTL